MFDRDVSARSGLLSDWICGDLEPHKVPGTRLQVALCVERFMSDDCCGLARCILAQIVTDRIS